MEHYATQLNGTINTNLLPQNPLFAAMVLAHTGAKQMRQQEEALSMEGECRVCDGGLHFAFQLKSCRRDARITIQ